jgi:hypothetical protein
MILLALANLSYRAGRYSGSQENPKKWYSSLIRRLFVFTHRMPIVISSAPMDVSGATLDLMLLARISMRL